MRPESCKVPVKSYTSGERWITVPAVMSIASMAVLVRSYLGIKLVFLALLFLGFMVSVYLKGTRVVLYRHLVWFYVWIALGGVVWAIVGALHPANYLQGVFDALRLYVVWSAAFVVLYTVLRSGPSLAIIHRAMVVAGILIPVMNFVALYDEYRGLGLIPESVVLELDMRVGFHDGYIQLTSENIGIMFLVAPYLLSLHFRGDAGKSNSMLTRLALVLSLILVVFSGRRALWIVVALTPCMVLLLSHLSGSYGLIKARWGRRLSGFAAVSVVGLGVLLILPENLMTIPTISHLKEAFSSEDERTIQKPYLIEGFAKSPMFGSGFGGYAGYQRNDERPWLYELTYHSLLFNTGVVGTTFLLALFSLYLMRVVTLLRRFKEKSAVPFGLLIAFFSLLVGAYSNPYFASFDFLFFAGLLPYLSTFQCGFDEAKSTAGLVVCP